MRYFIPIRQPHFQPHFPQRDLGRTPSKRHVQLITPYLPLALEARPWRTQLSPTFLKKDT